MASIKLKYVHQFVDKRRGTAKARFYFRRRGCKQVPLPGLPGSVEFNQAYEAALARHSAPPPVIGAGRIRPGTITALAIAYFNSPPFLTLSSSTRKTYRAIIEAFTAQHGDKPLTLLTRQHLNAMLARKVETPAAANHFAVAEGMRTEDPTIGIAYIGRHSSGFHTWTEDEIGQFEATHQIGGPARLALGLLLFTAQRRSDVVRMGRQHIQNGMVRVRQQKTGAVLAIPVHPDLQAIMDATPSEHLTFLVTTYGKPFTAAGFGNWFRDRCNEAGLPKHCAAHGLRKAACRRLAEAGCSANVIASISGHTTLREVERYTKAADQERMARAGMAAIISRTSSGNPN